MKAKEKVEGVCDGKYCRTFVKNGDGITVVTPEGEERYCYPCYKEITEAEESPEKKDRIEGGR